MQSDKYFICLIMKFDDFCHAVDEESMKSTKQYVQDAALNIAYHVHRYSSYFTTYLMLQDEDVESLQASTLALTAVRMNNIIMLMPKC